MPLHPLNGWNLATESNRWDFMFWLKPLEKSGSTASASLTFPVNNIPSTLRSIIIDACTTLRAISPLSVQLLFSVLLPLRHRITDYRSPRRRIYSHYVFVIDPQMKVIETVKLQLIYTVEYPNCYINCKILAEANKSFHIEIGHQKCHHHNNKLMHWCLWGVSHLSQVKLLYCNQILMMVLHTNAF